MHTFVAVVVDKEIGKLGRSGAADRAVRQAFSRIKPEVMDVDCECCWDTENNDTDPDCHGEGTYQEYFEAAGFDYWMVGGRFDGRAGGPTSPSNCLPVKEAIRLLETEKDYWFDAILTPDGSLHRPLEWFMAVRTAKGRKTCKKEQVDILREHEAASLIGVDAHD
jgi:hypothetical protein